MNKKLSKELLQKQIDKLGPPTNQKNDSWIHKTGSLIKDFFGEDSQEFKFIQEFKFMTGIIYQGEEEINKHINAQRAIQFLKDCMETIDTKGLYKQPKTNFLMRLDNGALISLILGVLTIIGSGCFAWGKYSSDIQNIELNRQVKEQRDTINKLKKELTLRRHR